MLNAHGPDYLIVDVIRWCVVIYGVLTTGWIVGRLFLSHESSEVCREGRALHTALLVAWLIVWLTEAHELSRPFLYWRLPLAVVFIPASWWAMHRHRCRHHVAPKRVDPWWWPVSVLGSRDGRADQPRRQS